LITLEIANRYSTTYHPQTNRQVKLFNRTIVGQLRTYFDYHQDLWEDLVSLLSLAYSSRRQESTRVAPLEYVPTERVRNLSVERIAGSRASEEKDVSPPGVHEAIKEPLRNLIHKVRQSLSVARRRYKRR